MRIEAVAERIAQIHATIGGTSGTKENTRKKTLVADPRNNPLGVCGGVCIMRKLH